MENINPTNTIAWKNLIEHYKKMKNISINYLFKNEKKRFLKYSRNFENQILVDFSKNIINSETLNILISLAQECHLKYAIKSMFIGKKINWTEKRAVLHIALRNKNNIPIIINNKDIMLDVNLMLMKIKKFCKQVITGIWKGYTKKVITDIVNIGIGGSNLGPYMVTEALKPYKNHLNIHFLSTVDSTNFIEIIKKIKPDTTLFLISSKTFTTEETLQNAYSIRNWFLKTAINEKYIVNHFIAISNNIKEVKKFGISDKNIFKLWDWVGGRYSLWSSAGLSIALSIGFNNFKKLLNGAYSMDQHFYNAPYNENIPVLLALISIWYNNFFNITTEAILTYDQYMKHFAAYLQQLNMESNGKNIDRNGIPINYQTGSIIWGGSGNDGQHSFYQLMYQGTKMVLCDFIAPVINHNQINNHHIKLISNFFAQTKALAFGKTEKLTEKYNFTNNKKQKNISLYKRYPGNKPTNTILVRKINPYNLGALIALYEHKIFTQGVILNIYSFDQWGVELGKELSNHIFNTLINKKLIPKFDDSTNELINTFNIWS